MANKVLSIYVGVDAIRVAEVMYNNKTVTLANAVEITTPEKSVSDGYIDDVSAVAEAIRTSIFGRGFSTKDVIFTIASKKIASKEITIPYIKGEKKMQGVLQANSAEYFPMSNTGDYSFAFTMLEDYNDAEGHKARVSAVACPTDLVKGYYEVARELKYKVKSIDYFGNSVLQLLALQMTPGRVDLVLQIENDQTIVNVMRGSTLVFQRSVAYGKNSVISSLMDVKKISEKDAKTLLSRDDYMEQYVTDDEYSAALEYLINGIKKAVEYYRNKVKEENLQGIKIFGEGSAMAGIGGVLERELGAQVEFFESLAGVVVKGQAALKASEVLRYLPNMGAVIKPLDLSATDERTSTGPDSATIIKILQVVFIVSTLVMIGIVTYFIVDNNKAKKERDSLNAQIEAIKDIEDIANAHEEARLELNVVKDFRNSTHNDNEMLLTFIEDLEKLMPTGTIISGLNAADGNVSFDVTTGWHDITKNEVADVIITIGDIPYLTDFTLPGITEEYVVYVLLGYDEDMNPEFLCEEDENGNLNPLPYDEQSEIFEKYKDAPKVTLVKTTYNVSCHINSPEKVSYDEGGYYIIKDKNRVATDIDGSELNTEAPAEENSDVEVTE